MGSAQTLSRTQRRREREREARIASIRRAGTRVFSRHGYRVATMDMVAREAELGKASLYYYYKTKQDLFADIVAQAASDLSSGLSRLLDQEVRGTRGGGEVVAPGSGGGDVGTGVSTGEDSGLVGPEGAEAIDGALATLEAILQFSLDYFSTHRDLLALALPLIAGGPNRLEEAVGPEVAASVLKAHAPVFHQLAPLSGAFPSGANISSLIGSVLIGLATKVLYGSERDLQEELNLFMGLLRRALWPAG